MIQRFLSSVEWSGGQPPPSGLAVFVDDGFAEYLKWSGEDFPESPVFPLRFDSDVLAMLQVQRPRGVLVFATSHEPHLVHNLKVIAAHSDCAHVVVASLVQPPVEEERLAYASLLATELQPVAVDIYRMQASALQLLKADEKRVGLFLLTAPVCRSMAPLSLHRMGLLEVDANLKSVNDILAEDIPPPLRSELKLLAGEIVSAVVDTLGLDPSGYVFALGKTSSIIGHSLHPLIAQAVKDREDMKESAINAPTTPLVPASLLVIDRSADLFTPASTAAGSTLFARMMATVERQTGSMDLPPYVERATVEETALVVPEPGHRYPMLDIDLQPPMLHPSLLHSCGDADSSQYTLSGLANLPVQIMPSICIPQKQEFKECAESKESEASVDTADVDMNEIWEYFLSRSEEETRAMLCAALKQCIEAENGSLPPNKKRGFGAELLALVTSLVCSPGEGIEHTVAPSKQKYNPQICLKYLKVLCFTTSIIDSLQRSSSKQFKLSFADLGAWKTSFEDRCLADSRVVHKFMQKAQEGLLENGSEQDKLSFTHSMKQQRAIDEIILDELKLRVISPLESFKSNATVATPVDVSDFLMSILSVSCMWGRLPSTSCVDQVKASLIDYILLLSPQQECGRLAWLPADVSRDIMSYRSQCQSETTLDNANLKQQLNLELADILSSLFLRITELVEISRGTQMETPPDSQELSRQGLLCQIVAILFRTCVDRNKSTAKKPDGLKRLGVQYIADPLKMLARAGLDLLSYGLNSFGLSSGPVGTTDPEPSDRGVIALFVVGGLSAVEIGQIQSVLALYNSKISDGGSENTFPKILLGSNSIVSPDNISGQIFSK